MKKLSLILLALLLSIPSCQSPSPKNLKSSKSMRTPSSQGPYFDPALNGHMDCTVTDKGCLLERNSDTVIIFFRGWVEPSEMKYYAGRRNKVAQKYWVKSSRDLISHGEIPLGKFNLTSSIFATGSSHVALTTEDMDKILEAANAKYLIFASHSGGYRGLRATILPAPKSYWEKVIGIWLLDNYYAGGAFAEDLQRNFGTSFLNDNCYGYVTSHNMKNFHSGYDALCPKTRTNGVTHLGGVIKCMPYFEQNEECVN